MPIPIQQRKLFYMKSEIHEFTNINKKAMIKINTLILVLFASANLFAQNANRHTSVAWTSNGLEDKTFVENKGQFNGSAENKSDKILFGSAIEGLEIFFTPGGLTYRYLETVVVVEKEKLGNDEEERGEPKMKTITHFLSMQWQGSDPNVEIISEEPVLDYYTYGIGIKANAFKKITYKNLYPNIDVEYVLPADNNSSANTFKPNGGVKYSLILHPGANASDIKMRWGGKNISADGDGNIVIKSSFGTFIDHAPNTFYQDGEKINSAFELSGSTVSFKLNQLQTPNSQLRTVIIDPWTANPGLITKNKLYDVNYDYKGNVYVYGGWTPYFQLLKYDATGTKLWTYNAWPMMIYNAY